MYALLLYYYEYIFVLRVFVVSHCELLTITLHLNQTLENSCASMSTMPAPLGSHDNLAMQATGNNLVANGVSGHQNRPYSTSAVKPWQNTSRVLVWYEVSPHACCTTETCGSGPGAPQDLSPA